MNSRYERGEITVTANDAVSTADLVLTAVRTDAGGNSVRWSVTGEPGSYVLAVAQSTKGGDWFTTETATYRTLTAAVEHDPALTRLPAKASTEFVIDDGSALALAAMLTYVVRGDAADSDGTGDEEPIGTVNGYVIRFLPRPDTSELVAVLVSDFDEPLGQQIGLYRWSDNYFPSTTGSKWLVEFAPGLAVAGGDGDFYQDLEVKVVGAAGPDAWEYDLAMDGEEWDLAVENGDAEFVDDGPGLGPLSLDPRDAGDHGTEHHADLLGRSHIPRRP